MDPTPAHIRAREAYRKWRAKEGSAEKARAAWRAWYAKNKKPTKVSVAPRWKSLVQVVPLVIPVIPEEYCVSFF